MKTPPEFNGLHVFESTRFRKCFRCRRPIGYRGESYTYGGKYDVCKPCHRRCNKDGCGHRVLRLSNKRPEAP